MGSDRVRDFGLLLLRLGIGAMFMVHGWPKLAGGAKQWAKLGKAVGTLGIDFAPTFFGFMAAVSEFFGGLLLALGLLFRPAAALMAMTMIVAASMHLDAGDGLGGASHAIESGVLFVALLLIGPGAYALDSKLGRA